jgi:predicted 3-demethylubiquinone-9 3-methyltransferase (glyoxalase superfamily)
VDDELQQTDGIATRFKSWVEIPVFAFVFSAREEGSLKGTGPMQKIVTFLWFDSQAEEAANFYTSIFKNSKIHNITRYGQAGPGPKGSVMSVTFQIEGQEFYALNGGPHFKFTKAISLFVNCETQQEVDELWESSPREAKKLDVGG